VLSCVSQWTQNLSMNGQVNISLIPLAVAKIKEEIETLHVSAVQFTRGGRTYIGCGYSKNFLQAV